MPRFAANLSMMFTEVPFLDRFEAAATGTGNLAVRAISWMMPRSFTKISTALRGA